MALGESSGYAMAPLQACGTLFILPQTQGKNTLFLLENIPLLPSSYTQSTPAWSLANPPKLPSFISTHV